VEQRRVGSSSLDDTRSPTHRGRQQDRVEFWDSVKLTSITDSGANTDLQATGLNKLGCTTTGTLAKTAR